MKNSVLRVVVIMLLIGAWFSQCVTVEETVVGYNYCQAMILDQWSTELIADQVPYFVEVIDSPTGGYPPALALAVLHDRWDAADIFIDYGADYEFACRKLRDDGRHQLSARLEQYAIERRKTHPILEVDREELMKRMTQSMDE